MKSCGRHMSLEPWTLSPKPVIPYVVERRVKSVIERCSIRENNLNDIAEQGQALMAQAEQLYEYGVGNDRNAFHGD